MRCIHCLRALTSLCDRGTGSQTCPHRLLQIQILSDLQLKCSTAPETGEKLPLKELGSALAVGFSGNLGKYTNGLIARMIRSRMPILLLGTAMEPPKRLNSEPEAKAWLDSGVAIYGQRSGITLSAGGSSGGGGRVGSGVTFNSEEFLKFQAEQESFVSQDVELYMRYLKRDSRSDDNLFGKEKANSAALQAKLDSIAKEHGDTYIDGIQPMFDPLKAHHFDSYWNWAVNNSSTTLARSLTNRLFTKMVGTKSKIV